MSDILKPVAAATTHSASGPSIWWWAFGYFACYVPFAALTKVVSKGLIDSDGIPQVAPARDPGIDGLEMLPPTVTATVATLVVFLLATGWWRHAGRRRVLGVSVPMPQKLTFLSGVCTSGIIATTTLAYTFVDVSIVFVMLLMRGGLLVLAPVVDAFAGRHVRWFSLVALLLSIGSLLAAFLGGGSTLLTTACAIDVLLYLGFYFVRLSLMSKLAKSADSNANLRYFVEEGMTSGPVLLLLLGLAALFAGGEFGASMRAGFTTFWDRPVVPYALVIGVLSQCTGIFGGLILLDKNENTFCVPVNRASSVLAGIVGSVILGALFAGYGPLSTDEIVGAGLIIAAIGFLSIPPALARRRAKKAAGPQPLPRAVVRS